MDPWTPRWTISSSIWIRAICQTWPARQTLRAAVPYSRYCSGTRPAFAFRSFHLLELTAPDFKSADEAETLPHDVPFVIANPFESILDEECACAVAKATGRSRRPPRVFVSSLAQWGYHLGPDTTDPTLILNGFRQLQTERAQILALTDWAARESMMKDRTAIVRNPQLPLELAMQRHLDEMRVRNWDCGDGLSAAEVIKGAGGLTGFPAEEIHQGIVSARLKLPGQKSQASDVIDEYIALYAPYAAVTTVDRRTYARIVRSEVPCATRVTCTLGDVPQLLAKIRAGELQPVRSA